MKSTKISVGTFLLTSVVAEYSLFQEGSILKVFEQFKCVDKSQNFFMRTNFGFFLCN